jgi:hypothetical protein
MIYRLVEPIGTPIEEHERVRLERCGFETPRVCGVRPAFEVHERAGRAEPASGLGGGGHGLNRSGDGDATPWGIAPRKVQQALSDPAPLGLRHDEQGGEEPDLVPEPRCREPNDSSGVLSDEGAGAVVFEQVEVYLLPCAELTGGPFTLADLLLRGRSPHEVQSAAGRSPDLGTG